MTHLGADPDHLREFARSMRSAAGQLDTLSLGLSRRTRGAGWAGPDAEDFQRQWHLRHRPALLATATGLSALSRRVEQEIDEQIAASSGGRSTGSANGVVEASGSARATATSEVLPPLPRSEDRYLGGVTIKGAVLTASIDGDLTIARLDHGRVQVDVTRTAAMGVGAAAGSSASVTIGGTSVDRAPSAGAAADIRAHLGAVERRGWEVDEDRLGDLLGRLAAEQVQEALVRDPRPLERAASVVDGALRVLTGHDPGTDELVRSAIGVPPPAVVEQLAEVGVAVGAGGALRGLGAHGSSATSVRAGIITERSGDRSRVVEMSSDSSAAITAAVLRRAGVSLPPALRSDVSVRLVLPTPPGDGVPDHLLVTTTSSAGERIHETRSRITLSGTGLASSAATASAVMDALDRGELVEAARLVGRLEVPVGGVLTESGEAELAGSTLAGGATGGAGLGAGFSARGQVLHLDRG